jgi:hypothetical protein
MLIGISRKKIVGLMAGGSLTLLGIFLPVGSVSAATLKGLLNKNFWISVGASAFYDQLLNPLLSPLPGFTEDTDLVDSAFEGIGIQTFIAAGGGVFYTDKNGQIADNHIAALVPFASSEIVSRKVSGTFKIEGRSPENAPYFIKLDTVSGETIDGFFGDEAKVNVNGFTLETGTDKLTGEQMYAIGFSFAFIDDEFEFIGANFQTKAMKTEPVPEPITIFGSAIGLGFGALFKKKYSRR